MGKSVCCLMKICVCNLAVLLKLRFAKLWRTVEHVDEVVYLQLVCSRFLDLLMWPNCTEFNNSLFNGWCCACKFSCMILHKVGRGVIVRADSRNYPAAFSEKVHSQIFKSLHVCATVWALMQGHRQTWPSHQVFFSAVSKNTKWLISETEF
jgi:hypothetical protein